jgi:hypothetical protein
LHPWMLGIKQDDLYCHLAKKKNLHFVYMQQCVSSKWQKCENCLPVFLEVKRLKIHEVWNGNKCTDVHCFAGTLAYQSGRLKLPAWR